MGYTHYWYQKREFTQEEWTRITTLASLTIANAAKQGIQLENTQIDGHMVLLDGPGETFLLERVPRGRVHDPAKGAFAFCKTCGAPYDAVVVTILHHARTIAPDAIRVESDGGNGAIKDMFVRKAILEER
jgi:hypothetical protein